MVANEGTTVFLTTHNMIEAEHLCRKVAVIRRGQLVAVGTPDELRGRTSKPRLIVVGKGFTEATMAAVRAQPQVIAVAARNSHLDIDLRHNGDTAPLVSLLVGHGAQVEEVHREKASLEEVFTTLTSEEEAR